MNLLNTHGMTSKQSSSITSLKSVGHLSLQNDRWNVVFIFENKNLKTHTTLSTQKRLSLNSIEDSYVITITYSDSLLFFSPLHSQDQSLLKLRRPIIVHDKCAGVSFVEEEEEEEEASAVFLREGRWRWFPADCAG